MYIAEHDKLILVLVTALVIEESFCQQACSVPDVLKKTINFLPIVDSDPSRSEKAYSVSCNTSIQVVYPLNDATDLYCSNNQWFTDRTLSKEILLDDLKCVNLCEEPLIDNGQYRLLYNKVAQGDGPLINKQERKIRYFPGVGVQLFCLEGYYSIGASSQVCGEDGEWIPPLPYCSDASADSQQDSSRSNQLIYIIVGVTVAVVLVLSMLIVLVVKARWRLVCNKRTPSNHPEDRNYPRGYTQLGSGNLLPSYDEAVNDSLDDFRTFSPISSVYQPTTGPTADYRQLSSLESSSHGESESISAASHRHSLFSRSSSHYRFAGDDMSDILVHGDHLSTSDNSTLVTVNTYESNYTASNPSLSNSRRGVAGSMASNTATSLDDVPLIVRSSPNNDEDARPDSRNATSLSMT